MRDAIWIAWETQRRSIELARAFDCDLFIFDYSGRLRYPRSIFKTGAVLLRRRPQRLYVQNPSMVLATLACLYGKLTGRPVIVDRHTTFRLGKKAEKTPRVLLFNLLHRFTIKAADLTIVTNAFLAGIVRELGGRPGILPDRLPALRQSQRLELRAGHNILLISSFGKDEPIAEVLAAMRQLQQVGVNLFITGNDQKLPASLRTSAPDNVVFTGFMPEQQFVDMLFSVDSVMTLTTAEYCMLCGCYEGVAAGKPLITSDRQVLRDYFSDAIFVDNTARGIGDGIREVVSNTGTWQLKTATMQARIAAEWQTSYLAIKAHIDEMDKPVTTTVEPECG